MFKRNIKSHVHAESAILYSHLGIGSVETFYYGIQLKEDKQCEHCGYLKYNYTILYLSNLDSSLI
jgi:hypothetical protein